MLTTKLVVLAALLVALAVNVEAWQRGRPLDAFQTMTRQYNAQHYYDMYWQRNNAAKADLCMGIPQCLIAEGVAI